MADNVSTFTEGQDVTSDMLNDIVKDLGNADFSYFTDGEPYAVDKLNEITKALVTKGVLMSENKCAVTYSNGKIYIAKGTIVFGNGAKIKNSSKLSISAYSGKATCIYAYYQSTKNRAVLVRSESEPADSDYIVMLACISADGVVTDLRPFCKAKCNLNVANQTYSTSISLSYRDTDDNENDNSVTIDVGYEGFNAALIRCTSNSAAYRGVGYIIFDKSGETVQTDVIGDRKIFVRAKQQGTKYIFWGGATGITLSYWSNPFEITLV